MLQTFLNKKWEAEIPTILFGSQWCCPKWWIHHYCRPDAQDCVSSNIPDDERTTRIARRPTTNSLRVIEEHFSQLFAFMEVHSRERITSLVPLRRNDHRALLVSSFRLAAIEKCGWQHRFWGYLLTFRTANTVRKQPFICGNVSSLYTSYAQVFLKCLLQKNYLINKLLFQQELNFPCLGLKNKYPLRLCMKNTIYFLEPFVELLSVCKGAAAGLRLQCLLRFFEATQIYSDRWSIARFLKEQFH